MSHEIHLNGSYLRVPAGRKITYKSKQATFSKEAEPVK